MTTQQIFALRFRRLAKVDDTPALVLLTIDDPSGVGPRRKVGVLTDVALRGRLGHYDLHSANELAAIRKALEADGGRVTVHEGWSGPEQMLKFWRGFNGSQIRSIEWTCEKCSIVNREHVGASVGETYARACPCGEITRITTASHMPPMTPPSTVPAPVRSEEIRGSTGFRSPMRRARGIE